MADYDDVNRTELVRDRIRGSISVLPVLILPVLRQEGHFVTFPNVKAHIFNKISLKYNWHPHVSFTVRISSANWKDIYKQLSQFSRWRKLRTKIFPSEGEVLKRVTIGHRNRHSTLILWSVCWIIKSEKKDTCFNRPENEELKAPVCQSGTTVPKFQDTRQCIEIFC